jgi:hypothetical protein
MKQLKIIDGNEAAIAELLVSVNGRASQHTFAVTEIFGIASDAENAALALLGSKKAIVGAQAVMRSGGAVPNAYKYARQLNFMTIERRSSCWWIIALDNRESHEQAEGRLRLNLTAAQAESAVVRFKTGFGVRT